MRGLESPAGCGCLACRCKGSIQPEGERPRTRGTTDHQVPCTEGRKECEQACSSELAAAGGLGGRGVLYAPAALPMSEGLVPPA